MTTQFENCGYGENEIVIYKGVQHEITNIYKSFSFCYVDLTPVGGGELAKKVPVGQLKKLSPEAGAEQGSEAVPEVVNSPPAANQVSSELKAEKLNIHIYSYLDEIQQPVVKLDIIKEPNDVNVTPDITNLDSINKTTANLTIPEIISKKDIRDLRFNNYFNRVPGEGAKTKIQSITGTYTTVANAIAELIKKRTDDNKERFDPFILFLRGQEQGKVLRSVEDFDGNVTYNYYAQLVGKQATLDQVTQNMDLIGAELEKIKQKVLTDSALKKMATQGAAQESALNALKNSGKFILMDKSGALSKKNFDNYIKNIEGLLKKINPDTGLLTGKTMTGSFDSKKVMGQAEIEKAVLTLPYLGGKTRKHKKSKTQKGGRRHKKTRKH